MLAFTWSLSTAWGKYPNIGLHEHTLPYFTYNISETFCADIQPRFFEDILSLMPKISCDEVRMLVRQGFSAWEQNSLISFVQTDGPANVVVDTSVHDHKRALAWAVMLNGNTTIDISTDFCWYTDRKFCDAVRDWHVGLLFSMASSWLIALVTIILVCRNPASSVFGAVARIVAWSVLLSQPLVVMTIVPCIICYDFVTVLMHEVGHGLGLMHSNDETAQNFCGCQDAMQPCGTNDSFANVMHATFQHRSSACLSRDDVDGLRTLWGGRCEDPVWCYSSPSLSGFYRLHTAFVYSFAIAWSVVFLRNRIAKCRRRRVGKLRQQRVESVRHTDFSASAPQSMPRLKIVQTPRGATFVTHV